MSENKVTDETVEEHCIQTWPRFPDWDSEIQESYRRTARFTLTRETENPQVEQ